MEKDNNKIISTLNMKGKTVVVLEKSLLEYKGFNKISFIEVDGVLIEIEDILLGTDFRSLKTKETIKNDVVNKDIYIYFN